MVIKEIRHLADIGKSTKALQLAEDNLRLYSSDVPFLCLYTKLLMINGKLVRAHKYLDIARQLDRTCFEVKLASARFKYFSRDFNGSIMAITELLQIDPLSAEAYTILGACQRALKQYDMAILTLSKVINISDKQIDALINRGLAFIATGEDEKGSDDLIKAYEARPYFSQIWPYVAYGYLARDEYSASKAVFKKLKETDTENYKFKFGYAFCLQKSKQYKKALSAYLETMNASNSSPEILNNLALCHYDLGAIGSALTFFQKALESDPKYTDAIVNAFSLSVQFRETNTEFDRLLETCKSDMTYNLEKRPNFLVLKAVDAYINNQIGDVQYYLRLYKKIDDNSFKSLDQTDRKFCTAYSELLRRLINLEYMQSNANKKIYHLGDSHCLEFSNRTLISSGHKISSLITFGAKAFHFGSSDNNRYKASFERNFVSLPRRSRLWISVGEIDCRQNEGIIIASQKLAKSPLSIISEMVHNFVNWINQINEAKEHDISLFNIGAPYLDKRYSDELNFMTTEVIKLFNDALRIESRLNKFRLIDIYALTCNSEGFSNMVYNIDNRHLSPTILDRITTD